MLERDISKLAKQSSKVYFNYMQLRPDICMHWIKRHVHIFFLPSQAKSDKFFIGLGQLELIICVC